MLQLCLHPNLMQQRSQNAEKNTHIIGRLLDQAMILFNCVPFQIGTFLKRKNLLPNLSFMGSSFEYGKSH